MTTLRMASPGKHPQTGVYYFRERPPANVAAKIRGETIAVHVAGASVRAKIGEVLKISLSTKDAAVARDRYREVQGQVGQYYGLTPTVARS